MTRSIPSLVERVNKWIGDIQDQLHIELARYVKTKKITRVVTVAVLFSAVTDHKTELEKLHATYPRSWVLYISAAIIVWMAYLIWDSLSPQDTLTWSAIVLAAGLLAIYRFADLLFQFVGIHRKVTFRRTP